MIARRVARPMLASIFISGGYSALRQPEHTAPVAEEFTAKAKSYLPASVAEKIPTDGVTLVRIKGGVHLVAGSLLAIGKFPRISALALAGTMVPITLAGHSFWEEEDPQAKSMQKIQFFKNVSITGGLLLAAVDTAGKPSVAWRGRKAAQRAGDAVSSALPSGSDSSDTVSSLKETVSNVAEAAKTHSESLAETAKEQAPVVADAVKEQAPVVAQAIKDQSTALSRRARKQADKAAKAAQKQFG